MVFNFQEWCLEFLVIFKWQFLRKWGNSSRSIFENFFDFILFIWFSRGTKTILGPLEFLLAKIRGWNTCDHIGYPRSRLSQIHVQFCQKFTPRCILRWIRIIQELIWKNYYPRKWWILAKKIPKIKDNFFAKSSRTFRYGIISSQKQKYAII